MLDKKIKFSATVDFSEFDRQVEQMQKRMADIQRPAGSARTHIETLERFRGAGLGPGATPADRQRLAQAEKQEARDREKLLMDQSRQYEKISKMLKDNAEYAKKAKDDEKETNRLLEVRNQLLTRQAAIQQNVSSMAPMPQGRTGQYDWAGKRDELLQQQSANRMNALKFGMGLVGTVANYAGRIGPETLANQASVAQNTYGQLIGGIASGTGSNDAFWMPQRVQAQEMAKTTTALDRTAGALARIAAATAGGALFGGVGGIVAGGGVAAYELYKNITGGYEKDEAARMQSNLGNLKAIQPHRQAARDFFMQNAMQDIGMMRATGMGEDQYRQALGNAANAGFTRERTIGMMSEIAAAGGSTDMMRNGATLANMYSRNMNLTNAGGALGRLSGAMNFQQADQSLMKIIAEGTRIGFNGADLAIEQRKFVEAVSGVISSQGLTGSDTASMVARQIAAGAAGQMTGAGISASMSAYEKINQLSTESSGVQAVLGYQAMARDPLLRKIKSESLRADIQTMTPEAVLNNPMIMGQLTRETGGSREEIKRSLMDRAVRSGSSALGEYRMISRLSELGAAGPLTDKEQEEKDRLEYEVGAVARQRGVKFGSAQEEKAYREQQINRFREGKGLITDAAGQPTPGDPKGALNEEEKSRAAQQGQVMKLARDMTNEFEKAAVQGAEFARSMATAIERLNMALASGKKQEAENIEQQIKTMTPDNLKGKQPVVVPAEAYMIPGP